MSCIFAYRQHQHTSIQNNSGLPQGPADLSPGRLLMRQTACARRSLAGMIGGGTLGREPHLWHEAARLHHAARRGGGVAVCSARAAAACDAYGRVPARRTNRGKTGGRLKTRPRRVFFNRRTAGSLAGTISISKHPNLLISQIFLFYWGWRRPKGCCHFRGPNLIDVTLPAEPNHQQKDPRQWLPDR
jgi:hypothetical protein